MAKTEQTTQQNETVDHATGEIITAENTAVSAPGAFDVSTLKLKKRVTIPVLKQRVGGDPIAVIFLTPMFKGDKLEGSKIEEPATLAKVLNVRDGHVYQIILHTVTKKELERAYPDGTYLNKGFLIAITSTGDESKRYKLAEIAEFDVSTFESRLKEIVV